MSRGALALLAVVAVAGCTKSIGPFVRNVHIDGYDLVVERCMITGSGESIAVGACTTERHRLPVTARVSGPPAGPGDHIEVEPVEDDLLVTPTSDQIRAVIAPVRDEVIACGASHSYRGTVRVRLVIDGAGSVAAVKADKGTPELAACITTVFGTVRFPASRQGVTVTIPFDMP